jgi:hypothetical protein
MLVNGSIKGVSMHMALEIARQFLGISQGSCSFAGTCHLSDTGSHLTQHSTLAQHSNLIETFGSTLASFSLT